MTYAQRYRDAFWSFFHHADAAEYRLACEGIKPELIAYLRGIGEAYGHERS